VHWHADVVTSNQKRSLSLLYRLYRFPERWVLRRASIIIATSPPYLESSEPLREFHDKCVVAPLGIEARVAPDSEIAAPAEDAALSDITAMSAPLSKTQSLRVLAVGRLTYYKGFSHLLEALAMAPGVALTLVGNGEEQAQLLKLAADLSLGDRFEYLDNCSDMGLETLYTSHDLLCLPSIERTEAFGVVLLEAMRAGLPCLVTDVPGPGMRWVVDAPLAGILVRAGDSDGLAKMLNTVAADRDILTRLQTTSRARFSSHFQIATISQSITDAYSKIVAAIPRRRP
jgi:rhamnosyl/mannosyltransferase